jgi:Mg-chelatase subunit ChlD
MTITQRKFLPVGILLFLVIAVAATTSLVQRQQELRGRASTQTAIPAATCGSAPVDIMIVIDNSGSMNTVTGAKGMTKLQSAIAAAKSFVDIISANTNNHIGLVSFNTKATLESPLTTDYATVKTKIGQLKSNGDTCTQCGATTADQEIHADGRANVQKVVILLTDGIANYVTGQNKQVSATTAEQAAITEIQNEFNTDNTTYFTIGLGSDVNTSFLQKIATNTNAKYFFSPSGDQLTQIYQSISQIIGKGSIAGVVFNDANNNGTPDTGESNLQNWTIDLKVGSPTSTSTLTTTTQSTNGYSISGLCDGTYYVNEEPQSGWTQTTPTNPSYYTVSIANGSMVADKNFGNTQQACGTTCTDDSSCGGAANGCTSCNTTTHQCTVPITQTPTPTITPVPSAMILNITALLHNIGSSGDNANPTAASFSNKNPVHPTRNATVFLYDLNNNQVADQSGTIQYGSPSGSFTGSVNIGTTIPSGQYYIKVQSDYHLNRLIPGIQTLTGGTNNLPTVSLVAGDADNSNDLSILDYNLLLGCYSTTKPAQSCTDAQKVATDFNDDGAVDDKDFNLFIRELSVQNGD